MGYRAIASLLVALLGSSSCYTNTLYADTLPLQEHYSKERQIAAQRWGLNTAEWQHYLALKQGERGMWSPGLDPLTMLGVEAQTQAEREHFAELLVNKEVERVEKELAFQRAYDAAWKKLYPLLMPVKSETSPVEPVIGKRLAFFTQENCPVCDAALRQLLISGQSLDIYLVGSEGDDSRIRRWALSQGIDIQRVKQHDITLNHDGGRWLTVGQGKMPVTLQQQGGEWQAVSP